MAGQEHDISSLEEAVNNASEVLREINDGNMLPDILEIIRQPGWTTPAEFVFALAMTESLTRELETARRTMQGIMAGARRVSTKE
jgi:hypothetical protein